jgi:hypothetical protein
MTDTAVIDFCCTVVRYMLVFLNVLWIYRLHFVALLFLILLESYLKARKNRVLPEKIAYKTLPRVDKFTVTLHILQTKTKLNSSLTHFFGDLIKQGKSHSMCESGNSTQTRC